MTDYSPKLCKGLTHRGTPCTARATFTGWCKNHDPAMLEIRRANGMIRMQRVRVANLPTLEEIAGRMVLIADNVESGKLDPKKAHAMVPALNVAVRAIQTIIVRDHRSRVAPTVAPTDPFAALRDAFDISAS